MIETRKERWEKQKQLRLERRKVQEKSWAEAEERYKNLEAGREYVTNDMNRDEDT